MKISNRVVRLRRELYELARDELERRQAEEVDEAVVEAARQELERIYDEMETRLKANAGWREPTPGERAAAARLFNAD